MKLQDLSFTNYMALPGLMPGTIFVTDKQSSQIIQTVSDSLDIPVAKMYSRRRFREFVIARHIAMFLLKRHTKMSLKSIGLMFGKRDHTTVIHAIATVNDLCATDPGFKNTLLKIENKL